MTKTTKEKSEKPNASYYPDVDFGAFRELVHTKWNQGWDFFQKKKSTIAFHDNENNQKPVSEETSTSNYEKQIQITTQRINKLRKLNVTDDEQLKLEYFFYTDTLEKAAQLAAEMGKLKYAVSHGVSTGDKNLYIITGWTTRMKMSDEVVRKWINKMCETGYKYDCDFDGWETNPDQEETN